MVQGIGGRRFLAVGAAGAVAMATLAAAVAPAAAAPRRTAPAALAIAVGYAGADSALVDAASLGRGDAGFAASGALVRIAGMCPTDGGTCAHLQSLGIEVVFPGATDAPCLAWSYAASGVTNVSSPAAFLLPVDASLGASFIVEACLMGGVPQQAPVTLATGGGKGKPKLATGTYVLALADAATGSLPDWSGHVLTSADGMPSGAGRYVARVDGAPAPFPYLVLRIAPAD